MAYQRALMHKNALLKGGCATYSQLLPWNELLVQTGGKVVENRVKFIDMLNKKAAAYHSSYAPTDGALTLELESDLLRPGSSSVDFGAIAEQFERVAQRELAQRAAVVGIQRDDVKLSLGGVDCRAYASQGQTRSVVLSLKLGVVELLEESQGQAPVVLLDDVDSEIDRARSELLFESLLVKPRQLLVSGTDAPPVALERRCDLQRLAVVEGAVRAVPA
jgi:DNA replication and repair protein RecF